MHGLFRQPHEDKVKIVESLLPKKKIPEYSEIQKQLTLLEKESTRIIKDDNYYDIMESRSIKLQNRVSEIIKRLHFDRETSDRKIIEAIEYYKKRDGLLGADTPLELLDISEEEVVFDDKGKCSGFKCCALCNILC